MHHINIKNKYIAFNKMNQIQDTVENTGYYFSRKQILNLPVKHNFTRKTSNLNFNSKTSIKTP